LAATVEPQLARKSPRHHSQFRMKYPGSPDPTKCKRRQVRT